MNMNAMLARNTPNFSFTLGLTLCSLHGCSINSLSIKKVGDAPDELTGKCSQRFQFPSANQRPLLVPLALTWVFLSIHEGDTSRQYVTELRRIAAETPMFPGSQKIGDKVVLKRSRASLFTSYATHVAFDEIESFYKRELPARGWSLPKGHSLINFDAHSEHYRRGDYCIAIESEASIFGSNGYSVVFIWDPE